MAASPAHVPQVVIGEAPLFWTGVVRVRPSYRFQYSVGLTRRSIRNPPGSRDKAFRLTDRRGVWARSPLSTWSSLAFLFRGAAARTYRAELGALAPAVR